MGTLRPQQLFSSIYRAFDFSSQTIILFNLLNKGINGNYVQMTYSQTGNSNLLCAILLSDPPDVQTNFFAKNLSLFSIADDAETATKCLQNAINKYIKC